MNSTCPWHFLFFRILFIYNILLFSVDANWLPTGGGQWWYFIFIKLSLKRHLNKFLESKNLDDEALQNLPTTWIFYDCFEWKIVNIKGRQVNRTDRCQRRKFFKVNLIFDFPAGFFLDGKSKKQGGNRNKIICWKREFNKKSIPFFFLNIPKGS